MVDAIQIESVGSVALKSTFRNSCRCLHDEMMSASRATVTVAAGVPKNKTVVKTNVSETEMVAEIEGTLIVKNPLTTARLATSNQPNPGGDWINSYNE